jgi:hypothetical protein
MDVVALSRCLRSSPVALHSFIDRSLHADGAEVVVRVAPFHPRIVANLNAETLVTLRSVEVVATILRFGTFLYALMSLDDVTFATAF